TETSGYQSEFSQPFTIEVVEPSASSSEVLSSTLLSDISQSTSLESSITVSTQSSVLDSSIASTEIPQSTSADVSLTASVDSSTLSSEIQSTVGDSTGSTGILSTSAGFFSTVSESSTLSAGNPLTTSVESFSSLPSENSQSALTSTDAS
ncbi:hypothetical protein DL95DRAFT_280932, partial [Leptodontidium sp. 2 PMI_412]